MTKLLLLVPLPLLMAASMSVEQTAATRTIARDFLHRMFDQRDEIGAYTRYAAPEFIQHDPDIKDGVAGLRSYLAAQEANGKSADRAQVIDIVLIDGDLFAVHHLVFTGADDSGQVIVDIWRVANGRIAEHWDVVQAIPTSMANGNGVGCGKGQSYATARALTSTPDRPTCGSPDPNTTRAESQAVIQAYTTSLVQGDVRESIMRWFSPDYHQHSPKIADGISGALEYLTAEFGDGHAKMPTVTAKRYVIEGDYVLDHHQVTRPGQTLPTVNADIFRVTRGKISEHWDVKRRVPEQAVNSNGMW
jgi:predicted SnoaL-like aldol condensation-catalyzing enzyme